MCSVTMPQFKTITPTQNTIYVWKELLIMNIRLIYERNYCFDLTYWFEYAMSSVINCANWIHLPLQWCEQRSFAEGSLLRNGIRSVGNGESFSLLVYPHHRWLFSFWLSHQNFQESVTASCKAVILKSYSKHSLYIYICSYTWSFQLSLLSFCFLWLSKCKFANSLFWFL